MVPAFLPNVEVVALAVVWQDLKIFFASAAVKPDVEAPCSASTVLTLPKTTVVLNTSVFNFPNIPSCFANSFCSD
jgi:hypothetical protein